MITDQRKESMMMMKKLPMMDNDVGPLRDQLSALLRLAKLAKTLIDRWMPIAGSVLS
jgi:hypothetical protein